MDKRQEHMTHKEPWQYESRQHVIKGLKTVECEI